MPSSEAVRMLRYHLMVACFVLIGPTAAAWASSSDRAGTRSLRITPSKGCGAESRRGRHLVAAVPSAAPQPLPQSAPLEDLLPVGSSCLQQRCTLPLGLLLDKDLVVDSFADCCDACKAMRSYSNPPQSSNSSSSALPPSADRSGEEDEGSPVSSSSGSSSSSACNVFAFCPLEGGCKVPRGSPGAGQYDRGSCLLYHQQQLQEGGASIKADTFSFNEDIQFTAGAPVQVDPPALSDNRVVGGYRLYANGLLPDGIADFNCTELSDTSKTQCVLLEATVEEVADACRELNGTCYGFQYLPRGNAARPEWGEGPVAVLKGSKKLKDDVQYRLYVGNFMLQSPSAQLYLQNKPLPSQEEWDVAYWLIPQPNMTDNVYQPSGCAIEYHTLYRGKLSQTLPKTASAVACCQACELTAGCNAWNFCPYPRGCNLTDTSAQVLEEVLGFTCRLLYSDVVQNGRYPVIVKQDPAEQFSSGLPPREVRRLAGTLFKQPRPNGREEGSSGCVHMDHYLYTGLILMDGDDNIHQTLDECCASCRADQLCNTFAWCPFNQTNGCEHVYRGKTYEPGACRLKHFSTTAISGVPTMYVGEGTVLAGLGRGPDMPWVSGNPVSVSNKSADGYVNWGYASFRPPTRGDDDVTCPDASADPMSVGNKCRYEVPTLQSAADICDNTDGCKAFVWLPFGDGVDDNSYSRPVAYLKGGLLPEDGSGGTPAQVDAQLRNATWSNPSAAVYVQRELLGLAGPASSESQDSSSSSLGLILGIAIGCGVVVLLIVVLLGVVAWWRIARQRNIGSGSDSGGGLPPLSQALIMATKLQSPEGESGTGQRPCRHSRDSDKELAGGGDGHPAACSGHEVGLDKHAAAVEAEDGGWGTDGGQTPLSAGAAAAAREKAPEGGTAGAGAVANVMEADDSAKEPSGAVQAAEVGGSGSGSPAAYDAYDWEVQPQELDICKDLLGREVVLGRGAFGQVYKARYRGGMYCAVKEIRAGGASGSAAAGAAFQKEAAILRAARSPQIVQFMGACQLPDRFLLVTELMEGGTLWTSLQRNRVSWRKKGALVALDVAQGLHFLHSHRVLHLDLKSANVLLDRNLRGKIGDVGMSQVLQQTYIQSLHGAAGTFAWAAPEVLLGERVGPPADVFSFGVLLHEICTGEEPQRGCMRPVSVPDEAPQAVADLIRACTRQNPSDRPTTQQLIDTLRGQVGDLAKATWQGRSSNSEAGGGNVGMGVGTAWGGSFGTSSRRSSSILTGLKSPMFGSQPPSSSTLPASVPTGPGAAEDGSNGNGITLPAQQQQQRQVHASSDKSVGSDVGNGGTLPAQQQHGQQGVDAAASGAAAAQNDEKAES